MTGEQLRAMQVSEFCPWLQSRTNQEKRPFQEEAIRAYKVAARALDAWMTRSGADGDFTACDTGRAQPVPPGLSWNRFGAGLRAAAGYVVIVAVNDSTWSRQRGGDDLPGKLDLA